MKLSQFANTYNAILQNELSLLDILKALEKKVGSHGLPCRVKLFIDGMADILENTISPWYLPTCRHATYQRYIWFAKVLMKSAEVLLWIKRLRRENPLKKDPGLLHLDCNSLYGFMMRIYCCSLRQRPLFQKPFVNGTGHKSLVSNASEMFLTNCHDGQAKDTAMWIFPSKHSWLQRYTSHKVSRGLSSTWVAITWSCTCITLGTKIGDVQKWQRHAKSA